MPEKELDSLVQRLREHLPESGMSEQQQRLLNQVQYHIHETEKPDQADINLRQSVELLINEIEADHPQGVAVAKKILEALAAIGI